MVNENSSYSRHLFFPTVASIILLLLASHHCSSQAIDSLKKLIKSEEADSKKTYLFKDLSRQYLILQELDSCLKYSNLGKEIALKIGDRTAEAYNLEMEGNFYYYNGLYEKAMEIFAYTLKVSDHLNEPELKARSYSMMGWIYLEQRRFDGAMNVFSQALTLLKNSSSRSEDLALAYYGLADVYSYGHSPLKDFKLAKLYFDSALRVSPGLQKRERAFVLTELGGAFRDSDNDYNRCVDYLLQAEKLLSNEPSHRDTYAYVLAELAYTVALNHEQEKAKQYATKSALIYEQLPAYRRVTSVYHLLSETFEMIGETAMAYKMERLNRTLSDSLFNHRNISLVEQIHAQYEDEKKQAEIKSLSESNSINSMKATNNRNIAIIVSVASLFILGLAVLADYNRSRYQKKIQTLKLLQTLREQKDQIARELHDSLGGQLSSISMGLNRLTHVVHDGSVQAIQNIADRALTEFRDSLWVMNKESISVAEIEQRIIGLFWQYRKIDTPVDFQIKTDDHMLKYRLSSSEAGHLYHIIQESTNNCVKHSKSTHFQVNIEKLEGHLQVSISDNGIGIDTQKLQDGEHYGMRNIKARTEQMDAALTIEADAGKGTTIIVKLPLTKFY